MAKRPNTRISRARKTPLKTVKTRHLKNDWKLFASVITVLAVLVVGAYIFVTHAETTAPLFNVTCDVDHRDPDDPIVYPNMPGASHMHSFFSNKSTNAYSTTASLISSGQGSCSRNMGNVDLSAYWVPSLYKRNADGTSTLYTGTNRVSVYYRRAGGSSGPVVKPFPQGLRFLAGNPASTAPQIRSVAYWQCGAGGTEYTNIPSCTGALTSDGVRGDISFPSCWDGVHLDSADHRSHMAYAAASGACPAGYPVSLPAISLELWYPNFSGGSSYFLSSDKVTSPGGYSLHGDFFAAWDNQVQNALVTRCLNQLYVCIGVELSGDGKKLNIDGTATANSINIADYPAASPWSGSTLITPAVTAPAPSPPVSTPTIKPAPTSTAAPAPAPSSGGGKTTSTSAPTAARDGDVQASDAPATASYDANPATEPKTTGVATVADKITSRTALTAVAGIALVVCGWIVYRYRLRGRL